MGVAEANNGIVFVLVAGAVFIHFSVIGVVFRIPIANGIGIRGELYHSEGHCSTGEGMAHALGTDKRIYILTIVSISLLSR